ncbi:MAG: phytanoyl-CoA dioxygenase family protein [Acidimicrobiales bacterium]
MLSDAQVARWERDGYLAIPDAIDPARCDELRARAEQIVDDFDPATVSIFSTHEQTRTSDEHFLASGDATTCFFEEGAFGPDGALQQPKSLSINKIGHAMHDLDPVFDAFSRQPAIADAARSIGLGDGLLLQSMYIFKQPRIGARSPATRTRPSSTRTRCRWWGSGSRSRTPPSRTVACGPNPAATSVPCASASCATRSTARARGARRHPVPEPGGPELTPIEARAGTLVLLHGLLPHWSDVNRSARSRHAYTVHVIDRRATYPPENWLRRGDDLPLRGWDWAPSAA